MKEPIAKPAYRTAVRGHCYSFIMPWEDIVRSMHDCMNDQDLQNLPREEDCLKYLLRLHLKVAGQDFHQHLKQVHLRPFVLVELLYELIEKKHVCFKGKGPAADLKERMAAAVEKRYPEKEPEVPREQRQGTIPPSILEMLQKTEEKPVGTKNAMPECLDRPDHDGDKDEHCLDRPARSFDIPKKNKELSLTYEKNATPGDAPRPLENALDNIRPKAFHLDKDITTCINPDVLREGTLERYGDLHIQTGGKFLPTWHTSYTSQALPFVIPRMVSGPDYLNEQRWRRVYDDAPEVSPTEFMRGFARRVEAQVAHDMTAIPIVRSNWFQYTLQKTGAFLAPYAAKRGEPENNTANEFIEAAKSLFKHLHKGTTGSGKQKMPIAGDTTRLPYANGLTPLERRLAWSMHFMCQNLPGVQQLRQLMGHAQFGARIVYGDCIFITVSPNSQHSALVLRLCRTRRNDPSLSADEGNMTEWLRKIAKKDFPLLEASEEDTHEVMLPDYEVRRVCGAREPLAVVDAYHVTMRLRLARLLGVRMCPNCPRCNEVSVTKYPCQDKFGSNMMPMGGVLGGVDAFGSATEFQSTNDPHIHGEVHIVCIYQFSTLEEIANEIKKKLLDPKTVFDFNAWLHREEPFNPTRLVVFFFSS